MIDLRQWRSERGLTQSQAANRLAMTLRHYQRLEAGHAPMSRRVEMLATLTDR